MDDNRDVMLPNGSIMEQVEMSRLRDEAKAYVKRMLEEACIPVALRIHDLVARAIGEIFDIYVKYGSLHDGKLRLNVRGRNALSVVRNLLIENLLDLIDDYAVDDEEDDDKRALLLFLHGEYKGATTEQRVRGGVKALISRFETDIANDAMDAGGVIGTDIAVLLASVVGVKSLERLGRTEVSRAWMERWREAHDDASYVHVFRGSSYDCPICDDVVSKGWQPVDGAETPPIHPNCRCYCVYV